MSDGGADIVPFERAMKEELKRVRTGLVDQIGRYAQMVEQFENLSVRLVGLSRATQSNEPSLCRPTPTNLCDELLNDVVFLNDRVTHLTYTNQALEGIMVSMRAMLLDGNVVPPADVVPTRDDERAAVEKMAQINQWARR